MLAAGAAGLVGGAAVGTGAVLAWPKDEPAASQLRRTYSPHETHQAGIVTPTPAATQVIALTLKPATDVDALARLMRVWSTDIAAMVAGEQIPGDTAPEMAQANTSLTVTVGYGPRVFDFPQTRAKRPAGFMQIPAMRHDKLDPVWTGGDLVLLVAADDPTTVAYCAHRLVRDAESFARLAWVQHGSWRGTDAHGSPLTGRNLFGQVDGTANLKGADADPVLWPDTDLEWFAGGTQLVVRRIEMKLDTWDQLVRDQQEAVIGRNLTNGAPLTGADEKDALDLAAVRDGRLVIARDAHSRRSHPDENGGRRIVRRGLNYTHDAVVDGQFTTTSGLIFMSFQADIANQFVPIQKKLDDLDALNEWTTAIGSAVFALPGGFAKDSWLGEKLFT